MTFGTGYDFIGKFLRMYYKYVLLYILVVAYQNIHAFHILKNIVGTTLP
jgi:hypothetical protein